MARYLDKLPFVGRAFFAVALVGLGAEHFVFQAFVTGRAPAWPAAVPGGTVWAFLTGAALIASGIAMLAAKHARVAAIFAATLIASWALLRHLPVLAAAPFLSPAWTQAGKALMLTGGALALAAIMPKIPAAPDGTLSRLFNLRPPFIIAGRFCLGLFLLITGVQHFLFTPFVASLIPVWFPGDATFWTYFAGVALLAGGAGLMLPPTARLAALLSGLMVFSWFWIVHVPRTLASVSDGIAVFEALAVSGIAFSLTAEKAERSG